MFSYSTSVKTKGVKRFFGGEHLLWITHRSRIKWKIVLAFTRTPIPWDFSFTWANRPCWSEMHLKWTCWLVLHVSKVQWFHSEVGCGGLVMFRIWSWQETRLLVFKVLDILGESMTSRVQETCHREKSNLANEDKLLKALYKPSHGHTHSDSPEGIVLFSLQRAWCLGEVQQGKERHWASAQLWTLNMTHPNEKKQCSSVSACACPSMGVCVAAHACEHMCRQRREERTQWLSETAPLHDPSLPTATHHWLWQVLTVMLLQVSPQQCSVWERSRRPVSHSHIYSMELSRPQPDWLRASQHPSCLTCLHYIQM